MESARLLIVFALIVLAIRRKLPVGVTLFGAGLVTALLYGVSLLDLAQGYWGLVQSARFIFLTAVIVLVTTLGQLLKELHFLDRLTGACKHLPGGSRTAAASLPPLVGLMPMPGGALLSAPLIGNVMKQGDYPPEARTVTNYWFRHLAEFCWPMYPGIILTEAITGMPLGSVSLLQAPLTLIMILLGMFFYIRKIDNPGAGHSHPGKALIGIASAIWPIVLAIALYAILRIDLAWTVAMSIAVVVAVVRPPMQNLVASLKVGFSYKLVFLVFGILSFQTALELSGAIGSIPHLSLSLNLPAELVIFAVCFTAGILTGMVAAYVALSYTLLAGFLFQPEIVPSNILLAYLSGYVGMMLSPTHLCLILTNNYFGSDLGKVYRRLAVPITLLFVCGMGLYFSGWGELFR